jgi:acyl-CoA hydrolase
MQDMEFADSTRSLLKSNAGKSRKKSNFESPPLRSFSPSMPSNPEPALPAYSTHFLVRHQDLNHAGTLFGGKMMAWADELAFVAASLSFPGCTFVTKVFEKFDFIHGPGEGAIVRIDAQVISRGNSSVRVRVTGIWAQDGQQIFTTEAIMVNAHGGHSVPIPRT